MTEQNTTISPAAAVSSSKKRGRRKVLLGVVGGLVLIVVLLVALAPTIASSMAPGKVEAALNSDIKGRVKVGRASVGWFKTLEAGPIEVYDPSGALVARVNASAPVTVWKVVSNHWWSAKRIELGTVQASGLLDLKQYNDGTTNLQRAMEPKNPSAAAKKETGKPSGKGAGKGETPSIQAALKFSTFDVSVRNEADNFKSELGIKGLTGTASVDADLSAPGGGTVKAAADMAGTAIAPGGAANGGAGGAGASPMTLKLDADIKQKSGGEWSAEGIERAKIKLAVANAPVAVADAVAQLGGALSEGMGDRADITADIDGNAGALGAAVRVVSAGLNADANLAIKDGVLTARSAESKPAVVSMKSTAFLERLPQTREGIASAKQQIRLTQAPSIELTLDRLSVPLPKGGATLETLDLRGANVGVRVRVSGLSGQVAIPEGNGPAPAAGAAGNAPPPPPAGAWKPFTVEPTEVVLNIEDMAKPIHVATGTKATLDGKPAGDLALELNAAGLLDGNGRLRAMQPNAGFADRADVRVDVKGVSTALVQPVVAGAGLPLDMNQDIGPTLDLNVQARANVQGVTGAPAGGGAAALPPGDVVATVRSNNINADVEAHLDKGVLTTAGKGIRLTVNSAAPLAQRIVAAGNKPGAAAAAPAGNAGANAPAGPAVALSGQGAVEVTVTELSLPLADMKAEAVLAAGKANAAIRVTDLIVTPNMGGSNAPVRIGNLTTTAQMAPGAAPHVVINSEMSQENNPFSLQGDVVLEGLKKGMPKSSGPGALAELNPTGQVALVNVPRSALWMVKALNDKFSEHGAEANKDEASRAIATAVREAIGANLTTSVRLLAAPTDKGGGQYAEIKLDTASKGVSADVWTRVTDKEAELSSLLLIAGINPQVLNPVLAALNAPAGGAGNAAGGAGLPPPPPMRIGAPSKLYVQVKQPARIPLMTDAKGGVTPDWAKASDVTVDIALEGDAVVEGVVMEDNRATGGNIRTATVALRGLTGKVIAPLSGLDEKLAESKRVTATLGADALDRTSGEQKIATLAVNASATMSGKQPDGEVSLTGLSTAHAEALIGQKDLLTGLLGETAEVRLKATPLAAGAAPSGAVGQATNLSLQLTSPRVKGADIAVMMDDAKLVLTKPASITLTPSAEFINKFVLGGDGASAPAGGGGGGGGGGQRQNDRSPRNPIGEVLNKVTPRAGESGAGGSASQVRLERSEPISIQIDRLAMALPSKGDAAANKPVVGPMKPGVFDLGVSVSAPSMGLVTVDGAGGPPTPITIEGLTMAIKSLAAEAGSSGAGPIEARLNIAKVIGAPTAPGAAAPAAGAAKTSTAVVRVSNLADATGTIDSKKAVVNADVDIDGFPTPIVDSLANQKGLLTELLGPTVTLNATARNVSQAATTAGADSPAGSLDATATSLRTVARVKGNIRKGVFVQTGETTVQIREIRTQLVKQLAGALPLVDSLEKTTQDAPALVTTENLRAPLDSDMSKLNGRVTVNPGVARFTTSNILGSLLKGVGGKEGGTIGRKIEPFVVNINKGVARYEQFKLPFGEFNLETRGEVDLVKRQMDIVTYAPFFALSEEALGKIKLGVGKLDLIDKATMVPITTKGSMDNPKTEIDVGLFVKELGNNLLKAPGDLLKEPGKIIDNIFGPKDKPADPANPAPANPAPKSPDATPPSTPPATSPPPSPPPANPPANPPQNPKPKPKPKPKDQPK